MRRILLFFSLLLSISSIQAGEGDWHLGTSLSSLINPDARNYRYGASLVLEKELGNRKTLEFALLGTIHPKFNNLIEESELVFTTYYKPILTLGKNSYGQFKLGPNMGFGSKGILFGVGGGFEYNIVLRNRIKLFLAQENILIFRGGDRFSMGLSLGIKLPL